MDCCVQLLPPSLTLGLVIYSVLLVGGSSGWSGGGGGASISDGDEAKWEKFIIFRTKNDKIRAIRLTWGRKPRWNDIPYLFAWWGTCRWCGVVKSEGEMAAVVGGTSKCDSPDFFWFWWIRSWYEQGMGDRRVLTCSLGVGELTVARGGLNSQSFLRKEGKKCQRWSVHGEFRFLWIVNRSVLIASLHHQIGRIWRCRGIF